MDTQIPTSDEDAIARLEAIDQELARRYIACRVELSIKDSWNVVDGVRRYNERLRRVPVERRLRHYRI